MNKKQFILQDALAGKPVVMRNRNEVLSIHYIEAVEGQKLLAIAKDKDGDIDKTWHNLDGTFHYDGRTSTYDLFMLDEPTIKFINVYRNESGYFYSNSTLYDTLEQAIRQKTSENYLKTIEITI